MNRVREYREAAGLNQRQLAERCHISPSIISEVENQNRRSYPKVRRQIARVLRVPIREVFPNE